MQLSPDQQSDLISQQTPRNLILMQTVTTRVSANNNNLDTYRVNNTSSIFF